MFDYEKAIHGLIDPLIEHPDEVLIKELANSGSRDLSLLICASNDDTKRLIGKRGAIANALREVIRIASKADDSNIRIHLKFESFEEDAE